jgi:hypothetical protein
MKIVLITTVALLAITLLGIINSSNNNNIVNAFAQGDEEMVEGNETGLVNSTGMINATLAFAQEGNSEIPPLVEPDRNVSMMSMPTTANQSQPMMIDLNGTINVKSTIAEAFKSKVTTDIIEAIQAAQVIVGPNSVVKEAELTDAHGYLVYKITAVDENMKKYKVIVDPGNGQVLMKKEVTWYEDEHNKMKYVDKEKYDKYGSSGHGYYDDERQ